MIAAWILYCALWTLWLSALASITERAVLQARGPARAVWIAAMALSVVGPIVGYALPHTRPAPVPAVQAPRSVAPSASAITQMVERSTPRANLVEMVRALAMRSDRPLAALWFTFSILFLLYVAGGVVRLRLVRRRWSAQSIEGTSVMISDNTGPALVGVFGPTIVIPAWALALEPDALALMLRHELEHRAAGDTRTIAVAQLLLALMSWNPLLWWQLRRLRLAIELDCDARVLRATSDVAAYGKLLLEFGRQRRAIGLVGAALADHHASQLETRIRRMTRRSPVRRRYAAVCGLAAATIGIAIGCQLPTPPSPTPTDASRSVREDSAVVPRAARALARSLDTLDAHDRELIASINEELERRKAELQRTLREAELRGDFRKPLASSDWLAKKLFEAQIGLSEARDSLTRTLWEARLDTARWMFDSTVHSWPGPRVPMSYMQRVTDSLTLELSRLRMHLTDDHPQVRELLAKIQSMAFVFPDSVAALEPSPGCTSGTGESVIKLIVPNEAALRPGVIVVQSETARSRGAVVEFDGGMTCSGPGELRLYGRGAFDGRSIVIRSTLQSSMVVVTGSGLVLAGPTQLDDASRRYELAWSPR